MIHLMHHVVKTPGQNAVERRRRTVVDLAALGLRWGIYGVNLLCGKMNRRQFGAWVRVGPVMHRMQYAVFDLT